MTATVLKTVILGGGPAGLMAAERLNRAGLQAEVYDAMPSLGRKFLMAGKGGMNITHAAPFPDFCAGYGVRQFNLQPMLDTFGPQAVREWMSGLGIDSFIGTSGRVFPIGMKAAPLLRNWLHRLRETGVRFHVRHRWHGIERLADGKYELHFLTPTGEKQVEADSVILALGGGSWAKLGSDGQWVSLLEKMNVPVAPLRPANCGFDVHWSEHLRKHFSGHPVKNISASLADASGHQLSRRGEFVITEQGIEGSLIYTFSAPLRDTIERQGHALLILDLLPDIDRRQVIDAVAHPRGSRSLANHLQSRLGLKGIKTALLHECLPRELFSEPKALGEAIKALPIRLNAARPLDEAISSAGGVCFEALDEHLMIRCLPGIFCAGEMLDWEAPTGGYLLTGCLSTGFTAGQGACAWLKSRNLTKPACP